LPTGPSRLSFAAAALTLIATFVASAVPIPLYGLYRAQDGLSYLDLSLSSVVYFIGAITALLVFGRLSNHTGRRPTALLAVGLTALAAFLFLDVHDVLPLLIGRLLQGLSCGLASTALAAWVADCAPSVASWLTPAVISTGPMLGLTLGALSSGALAEYGPLPRQLVFFLLLGLLGLCVLLIMAGRETVPPRPGILHSLIPRFALPPVARRAYPAAACIFVCTWSLGGFFQAYGPAMAHEQLHSSSAVAAALVFASFMAPSVAGASLAGRFAAVTVQRYGILLFALSLGGLLLAMQAASLPAFLVASALAGSAQGAVLSASIRTMVSELDISQRADVLSVIYITSYSGAAIPTLIAGQLSGIFDLLQLASGYALLALAGTLFVFIATRNQTRHSTESQEQVHEGLS